MALLPVSDVVIDAEIVACDAQGRPNFRAIHGGAKKVCSLWCFDLMALDERNMVSLPLSDRWKPLAKLSKAAKCRQLRYSDRFDDQIVLLQQAASLGLEGIVSKVAEQPYVSGTNRSWVKVKARDWREANNDGSELFTLKRERADT